MRVMNRVSDPNNPAHPSHSNHLISTGGLKAVRFWPLDPMLKSVQETLIKSCNKSRHELCGVISSEWDIFHIENAHEEPSHNFYMDQRQFSDIVKSIYARGATIIGVWHTHPNNVPWPSPRDIVGWPNPALKWRYWVVTNNEVLEWVLKKAGDSE